MEMSADVHVQLIDKLKVSNKFALQLNESTDVANCAMLFVYVRFINHKKGTISQDFWFSNEFPSRTTSNEIFNLLDSFMNGNGLHWENCVGITAAMTGKKMGFVKRIKNAVSYHCIIHRGTGSKRWEKTSMKFYKMP